VAILLIAGDQVPVIGGVFVLDAGNIGIVVPAQYGPVAANVGVTIGVTVIVVVAVLAHCPAPAVNV
jgi:hypothetical protein